MQRPKWRPRPRLFVRHSIWLRPNGFASRPAQCDWLQGPRSKLAGTDTSDADICRSRGGCRSTAARSKSYLLCATKAVSTNPALIVESATRNVKVGEERVAGQIGAI